MGKYHESSDTFQFSWNQVVQGFWQKYPNPHSSHVLSEDTVCREIKNGKLYSKRLLTKTNRVPKWGERFISKNVVKIIEESVVDPEAKILTTYTRNIGYTRVMSIVEKVVYRVSDENPEWTEARRSAWVDSQVFGFSRAIQAFGLDRLKKNCVNMTRGFNHVLQHMFPPNPQYMIGNAQLTDSMKATMAGDLQYSLQGKAEKVKGVAKKATDLAKQKAGPIYAACQPNQS